jgi:hypothetical protein
MLPQSLQQSVEYHFGSSNGNVLIEAFFGKPIHMLPEDLNDFPGKESTLQKQTMDDGPNSVYGDKYQRRRS